MSNTRKPINRISHLFDQCSEPTPIDQSGPRYPIEAARQPQPVGHEVPAFFAGVFVGLLYNAFFAAITWLFT